MVNTLLNRFTPKEPKFFVFLKQVSEIFLEASNLLSEALTVEGEAQRRDYFTRIKEKEHAADALNRQIFDALGSSFITPFDREDIHSLAECLDDVIDLVNSCAKRLAIYNPKHTNSGEQELGKLVVEDAKYVDKAMVALSQISKGTVAVKACIEQLHELENKADEIYETAIIRLFGDERDAIELMKTKEILSELEKTTDAAERIGKVLKTIVVKYA